METSYEDARACVCGISFSFCHYLITSKSDFHLLCRVQITKLTPVAAEYTEQGFMQRLWRRKNREMLSYMYLVWNKKLFVGERVQTNSRREINYCLMKAS